MSYRLLLVGPPGAGKGTQAKILCERLGIETISTGALFRAHAAAGDELGQLANSYTSKGELVPDSVTNRMVDVRLDNPDVADGFLLDGYPRNVDQVYALDELLEKRGVSLDAVIEMTAENAEVISRLLGRAKVEGRADDTEEVIAHRIELYHETTEPLLEVYRKRGLVVQVDGMGTIDEVSERIYSSLLAFVNTK